MDKKELLKRWALAYTESSLFYVPWRGKDIEGFLSIHVETTSATHSVIIGGIFTLEGKLITKVSFADSYWFQTYLKIGTYVYKEAVSPEGYNLSDNIVFEIKSDRGVHFELTHEILISHYRGNYEKLNMTLNVPNCTIYDLYGGHILHRVSNDDATLIRKIFATPNPESYVKYVSPAYVGSEYNSTLLGNYLYRNQYVNQDNERVTNFKFGYFIKEPENYIGGNYWSQTAVKITWVYGEYLFTSTNYSPVNVKNEQSIYEKWYMTVSKEKLFELYDFIKNNNMAPDYSGSSENAAYYRYSICIDKDGNYYKSWNECPSDEKFWQNVYIFRKGSYVYGLPKEVTLQESKNISTDILNEYNLAIENNIYDMKKYFYGIDHNTDDLHLTTIGSYAKAGAGVYPKSVINQELLDIINNSESGGET